MYKQLLLKIFKENKLLVTMICIFTMFVSLLSYTIPQLQAYIINVIFEKKDVHGLMIIVLILALVVICIFIFDYISRMQIAKLQFSVVNKLKLHFMETIVSLELINRQKWSDSELQTKLNEINNVSSILSNVMFKLFGSSIIAILSLLYLARISIGGVLLVLIFIPLSYYANVKSITEVSKRSLEVVETNVIVNQSLMNFVKGLNLFKLNFRLEEQEQKFRNRIEQITDKQIKRSRSEIIATSIITNFNYIITVVFMVVYGLKVINGELNVGIYIAALQYVSFVFVPITLFASSKLTISPALVSYTRTIEFIEQENVEMNDGKVVIDEIKQVEFLTPKFKDYVTTDLLGKVSMGETFIVSGANGSGKSTILKMLLKLHPIDDGEILINGISLENINRESLWKNIHYVSQQVELFEGSLFENIIIENDLSLEKFEKILKIYGFKELTENIDFNKQLTIDSQLSLGEKKQIALLRLVITRKPALIVDELAASLDKEWTKQLEEILKSKQSNSIIIRIEHKYVGEQDL